MFLVYHGTDEYAAREELDRLRVTGGFDINQDVFTGDEADPTRIRVICDTLPFLSERRLVVVLGLPKQKRGSAAKDDDDAPTADAEGDGADGAADAEDEDTPPIAKGKAPKKLDARALVKALLDYAPKIPETATLVVVAMREPDAKPTATLTALIEGARKLGGAREFNIPTKGELSRWVTARAKAVGARITPEAAEALIAAVGDNTRELVSEIEKLSVYAGRGAPIDISAVRALTPDLRQSKGFDLTDALAGGQRVRALTLLHEFLAEGQAPLQVLGLIASQTRALLQVKALAERGMREQQIAAAAGMAPYAVTKALRIAGQFTYDQLRAAHRAALNVDVALKSSQMSPEMALDLLLLQFGATDPFPSR